MVGPLMGALPNPLMRYSLRTVLDTPAPQLIGVVLSSIVGVILITALVWWLSWCVTHVFAPDFWLLRRDLGVAP